MRHNKHSFIIPDNHSISALVSLLQNKFTVQEQAETVNNTVFYDTFDWRLYKNGSAFELQDGGASRRIYWRAEKGGRPRIQLGLSKIPRLAADLPACELRQQLQSVISVRELLPRVKIKIKRQSFTILDKNRKVVVRLNFDSYWHRPSRLRAARVLSRRVTVIPVKGYAKDDQRVNAFFVAMPLQTAQDNLMKLALIASGVSTDDYTTRLVLLIEQDMSAAQVLKSILLRLLEIIRQNTAGSIQGRDTEFIHDYLESVRKTRAALMQINGALPSALSTKYNKFFSTVEELTNPVRELDLFLLQLDSYQASLEEAARRPLRVFREYLLLSREALQTTLTDRLKSSHYREDIKQWRDYLEHPDAENTASDNHGKALYQLADELIWKLYQKTIAQGKATTEISQAEVHHTLDRETSKLCYLIEFFRSIYPAVNMRLIIQLLGDLQHSLGKFNELTAYIEMVKTFIEQSDNDEAIKACEQMIYILQQQQLETGNDFRDCYAVYSSSEKQKKFKEMFVDYHRS